jgi:hypothetical protein
MERFFKALLSVSSITILVFSFSCNIVQKKAPEANPVAKVFETYLYAKDIQGLVPKGSSKADSLAIIKKYIQHWTEEQILLHHAENNLGEQQQDLSRQIEDYKASLIIYAYEKELVHQKLDTNVSDDEIQNYYNQNKKDFQLKNDIVKIIYVKVTKKSPNLDKVKGWINSTDPKDRDKLSKYCYQFSENFFLNEQVWLMFDDVLKEIPIQTYNQDLFLQNNRFVQIEDSANIYFLGIKGYLVKNSISPLSFEKENIRKIVLNKRKMDMVDGMKKDLYEQAQLHNDIKIY